MNNQDNVEQRISDLEVKVQKLEAILANRPQNIGAKKVLSEKEFLLEMKPKSVVEKTFFLGVYLEKYKEKASFTVEDLRKAFRAAKEPVPANINDNINKNIKKGFFMEAEDTEETKAWMITATGERILKNE